MAKIVGWQNSFTAGEIGPDGEDRSDLQQWGNGFSLGANMIPATLGPLKSRGGFLDRGAVLAEAYPARIVAFVRSSEDTLFLELGQGAMRVWTTAGDLIVDGADAPYELATPWTAAQAQRLWFRQEGDVLYVTDLDGGPTRVIQRAADDDWSIELFDFREGPWLPEAVDVGVTITASAASGAISLTTSAPRWTADDIGSLVQVRQSDGSPGLNTWTSETEYSGSQQVQFDGRVYERTSFGPTKSGTTPPLHSEGTVSDGSLNWIFVHDGRGVARIDTITSSTVAQATVIRPMPTTEATKFWSKQAYSKTEGYPRALAAEREERLVFGSSSARPGTVDATRTAGFGPAYGDFKPNLGTGRVVEDDAVRLNAAGAERLVWLVSATVLLAGTTGGEYALSGAQLDEPMTPEGRRAAPLSRYGNADIAPLLIAGPPPALLHVTRSRTEWRETLVSPDLSVRSRSLSVLAHHIYDRGIAEQTWQKSAGQVWFRLDDGGLAVARYDSDLVLEQQVAGATRQPLPPGWTVESIASAPAPQGRDVLMVAVTRIKGPARQRRIWLMTHRSAGVFVDGGYVYDGAPKTVFSGLSAYAGETLVVAADGGRHRDVVVSDSGAVTLERAASKVVIGQPMLRRFESLPLDMEGPGSTNARTILPTHATVILTTAEADVGTTMPSSATRVRSRQPEDLTGPATRRLRQRVGLGNGSDRDIRMVIETTAPFDLIVHAYRLEAEATK